MMANSSEVVEILRSRKLKATPTRVEVLSIIADHEGAIPYSGIQNALQDFDRITLYRTINALTENGIIHKALTDGNEAFYALCSSHCSSQGHHHKHVHFKCTNCRQVSCVRPEKAVNIAIRDHVVSDFEIEVTGLCSACKG